MHPREFGPHRYYTRRRAHKQFGVDTDILGVVMGDSHDGSRSPHQRERWNPQEDPNRELFRTLINTQPLIIQGLDRLQNTLDRMDLDQPKDRHDRHDRHDRVDKSIPITGSRGSSRAPSSMDSALGSPRRDRTHSRTTNRPMQPHFPPRDEPPTADLLDGVEFQDVMATSDEWARLPEHVRDAFPLPQYCSQRRDSMRNRGDRWPRQQHNGDLHRATSKLTISSFDGSEKITTRAWVHKLDIYLSLKPILEDKAI